eukprot:6320809-Alexandrium_andersonii.AAC.1
MHDRAMQDRKRPAAKALAQRREVEQNERRATCAATQCSRPRAPRAENTPRGLRVPMVAVRPTQQRRRSMRGNRAPPLRHAGWSQRTRKGLRTERVWD